MADIRGAETDELKEDSQVTVSSRRRRRRRRRSCVDRQIREAVERDGRIGLGDAVNVRAGGRRVKRTGGEEYDDGESVGATAEDELA